MRSSSCSLMVHDLIVNRHSLPIRDKLESVEARNKGHDRRRSHDLECAQSDKHLRGDLPYLD